jgi:hypothetical protein
MAVSKRRQAIEDALERHRTNGVIKDWWRTGPTSKNYGVMLANGQTIQTGDLQYIDMICLGLDSASQAWRNALPGQGNSPAEAQEMGLSLADRLRRQAQGDDAQGSWAAIAREHATAFREILGVSPADVYEKLIDWKRQGAVDYVLPSDPMGEYWVIGMRERNGEPYILKLGHDTRSAAAEAGVFLASIGQGALWSMRATLKRLGRAEPELEEMFGPAR